MKRNLIIVGVATVIAIAAILILTGDGHLKPPADWQSSYTAAQRTVMENRLGKKIDWYAIDIIETELEMERNLARSENREVDWARLEERARELKIDDVARQLFDSAKAVDKMGREALQSTDRKREEAQADFDAWVEAQGYDDVE
jgi:hypothetical protein